MSDVEQLLRWQEFGTLARLLSSHLSESYSFQIPVPVEKIVSGLGIPIIKLTISADGYLAGAEDNATIQIRKDLNALSRRFTIAHELGHWLLNRFLGLSADEQNRTALLKERVERACDHFAATLLLPSWVVEKHFRSGGGRNVFDLLEEIGKYAQVPLRVVIIQLHHSFALNRLEKGIVTIRHMSLPWRMGKSELRIWESACPSWGCIPAYRRATDFGFVNINLQISQRKQGPQRVLETVRVLERVVTKIRQDNTPIGKTDTGNRPNAWKWRSLGTTPVDYITYRHGERGVSFVGIFDWSSPKAILAMGKGKTKSA